MTESSRRKPRSQGRHGCVISLIMLSPVIVVIVWMLSISIQHRMRARTYEQVSLPSRFEQLVDAYRQAPTFVYSDDEYEVAYYCFESLLTSYPTKHEFMEMSMAGTPPFVYECYQFLIDRESGNVIGKTCCGEELNVWMVGGTIPGADILELLIELGLEEI